MDESIFKSAVAAISEGEYCESDIKVVKEKLNELNKKELSIKRKIEKAKNEFVKTKDKTESELKSVRQDIKSLKNVMKTI